MGILVKAKDAFLNACIRAHSALNNRKGSQTVEVLIIVLIVIIVGAVLLGVFKDRIPGLANLSFDFAEGWFNDETAAGVAGGNPR